MMLDDDKVAVVTFNAEDTTFALTPQLAPTICWQVRLLPLKADSHARTPSALWDALHLAFAQPIRPDTDFIVVTAQPQPKDPTKIAEIRKQLFRLRINLHLIHFDNFQDSTCETYQKLCSRVGVYQRIDEDVLNAIINVVAR